MFIKKIKNIYWLKIQNLNDNEELENEYLKINLETKNCNNLLFAAININSIIMFSVTIYLLFYLVSLKHH